MICLGLNILHSTPFACLLKVRPSISGNNFWISGVGKKTGRTQQLSGRVNVFVESRLNRDLSLNVDEGSFFMIILGDFEKLFLGNAFALQVFRIFSG